MKLGKKSKSDLQRIFKHLQTHNKTWIALIEKDIKLNRGTVSRLLNTIDPFIERKSIKELLEIQELPTPNLPVIISLKPNVTKEKIENYLKLKKYV